MTKTNFFRIKVLKLGTILALSAFYPFGAGAVDVSSWQEWVSNSNVVSINLTNDFAAEGTPKVITLKATEEQTIEGNGHSVIGADGYSFTLNGENVIFNNLGKYSTGTSANYTFSYKDLENTTKYVNIEASVNSFPKYLMTRYQTNKAVDINNSVFTNNGGRIVVINGTSNTLNVKNSVFYDNTSTQNVAMFSGGGGSVLNIENSVFYNNSNTTNDGGVANGFKRLTVKDSYFINNHSGDFGGALNQIAGIIAIEGSKFEGNTSSSDGGAICLDGNIDNMTIKDSVFINNRNGGSYYDGGAISTGGGYIQTLDNVLFDSNVAISGGGGVYGAMNSKHKAKDPVFFKNVVFKNNEAGAGGGYYSEGNKRQNYTYITDSEFTSNTVKEGGHYLAFGIPVGGGLINTGNVPMIINNTTFTGNKAILGNSEYSAGGGMYFVGGSATYPLKIIDATFTNNSALEGGAIYIENADVSIVAATKNVEFSGNRADRDTDDYNGGADIYFDTNSYSSILSLNAADEKKIIFNDSVAAYEGAGHTATIDINKSGVTYNTYDGTTETSIDAGTTGEVQFNARVGDEDNPFTAINLYGGKLSIGQNAENNDLTDNPDGYINDNNFYVLGDSILNTANGYIGEFAPQIFDINAAMEYQFDIDLASGLSDKLVGATVNESGSVKMQILNVITDAQVEDLKITYSDTNIGGILQDDYEITTSTASYSVSSGNDDTGSYLLFTRTEDVGGLPNAIKNASDAYSITSDEDEVITAWVVNDLQADLAINANGHAITTENGLDGINVGSSRTLTVNGLTGMSGFNYAFSNSGTVNLTNTTINDDIINNGILEVNDSVSLGAVLGAGTTNINADNELSAAISGNTVNVNNAKLSGVNNLASDVILNVLGGTVALDNQTANLKSVSFDANSTLSLSINSLSDYGKLIADSIVVANGAKLNATLAQGLVKSGEKVELQLLSANNSDFNNFSDNFDNNMYHFEKVDKNGTYRIYITKSAEEVIIDAGGQHWVAQAAKAYVDGDAFEEGSVAANIADSLAGLAQNDAKKLIKEIKALAPAEASVVQDQAIAKSDILFKTTKSYLRGDKETTGFSYHDIYSDMSIWSRPYVIKTKIDNNDNIIGYEAQNIGIITGIDKKINAEFKLGAGLQYDEADIDATRREINSSTRVGFVYAEYKPANWFVNTIAAYGVSDYDEKKFALGKKYSADYNAKTRSMTTTFGYQIDDFIPEISMLYYNIKRNKYTDTASQYVKASKNDYLRATVGVRFNKKYKMFYPDVYFGLGYDIKSPRNNTFVKLSNGAGYTVEGKHLSRLEYEFNVGLNAYLTDNITVGIGYMGSYRKDYQEHTGMLRFNYAFE